MYVVVLLSLSSAIVASRMRVEMLVSFLSLVLHVVISQMVLQVSGEIFSDKTAILVFLSSKHHLHYTGSMYFGRQFNRKRSYGLYSAGD